MITRVSFFVCLLYVALVNAKTNRIIGGYRATPGQFKYQVAVLVDNDQYCGGAIIADQYVLTAAHCVVDQDAGRIARLNYKVIAGTTYLLGDEGERVDVKQIYVPMKYLSKDNSHDIAVLKLYRGLGLDSNPNLQKINLPSNKEPFHVDETAVFAGYGLIYVKVMRDRKTGQLDEFKGRKDHTLKYVNVKIISNAECLRQNPEDKVGKYLFCGQTVQSGRDPEGICTGDSGGPLVIGNKIIGIASQSPIGCNEQLTAAVYTRVSTFVGFIEKAMKDVKSSLIANVEIHSGESSSSSKGHGKSKCSFLG